MKMFTVRHGYTQNKTKLTKSNKNVENNIAEYYDSDCNSWPLDSL